MSRISIGPIALGLLFLSVSAITVPPLQAAAPQVGYIHDGTIGADDDAFASFLKSIGFETTFIALSALDSATLKDLAFLIVANDTGSLASWGDSARVVRLLRSGKPILGIGEGGYALFGKFGLKIGYPNGAHGAGNLITMVNPGDGMFRTPNLITSRTGVLQIFDQSVERVEIWQNSPLPSDTYRFGQISAQSSYYVVAQSGRFLLWGFSSDPRQMTADGKLLLENALNHLLHILQIDTLIVTNFPRMSTLGYTTGDVSTLQNRVSALVGAPYSQSNMHALWRDLSLDAPVGVTSAYSTWNSSLVTSTQTLVGAIDTYIENLKHGAYSNIQYVIMIGAHEVIPMKPRAADNYEENLWGAGLASGPLKDIITSTQNGASGYYLTDSVYSDLSYVSDGWGSDRELMPELMVGRLVETPLQIDQLIVNYLAANALLSRSLRASLGSSDFMDGAQMAADAMGSGVDTALIQASYDSSLVPPKINAKPNVVFIGGHGNYNWITTGSGEGFMAGATASQGDTEELNNLPNAVIVADGCHNGVNFWNRTYRNYDGTTNYGDFPERLANKQVGIFVGATGYTWISISGSSTTSSDACCSEKLAALVVDKLLNSGNTTAGKAFKAAAKQYMTDAGTLAGSDRRVISTTTLFGIPNYKIQKSVFMAFPKTYGYVLTKVPIPNPPPQTSKFNVSTVVNSWYLANVPQGNRVEGAQSTASVVIPGANSTGDENHPFLPVISAKWMVPEAGGPINVFWNSAASTSTTIVNDVPLTPSGTSSPDGQRAVSVPGQYTETGFYPSPLYFTTTFVDVGNGLTEISLNIIPVQYNKDTHQTRIWTKLVFDIELPSSDAPVPDSDGDGLPDYWELSNGLDPNDPSGENGPTGDPDGEGSANGEEYSRMTDAQNPDTDGDGANDSVEARYGTDPLNPTSKPTILYLPLVFK